MMKMFGKTSGMVSIGILAAAIALVSMAAVLLLNPAISNARTEGIGNKLDDSHKSPSAAVGFMLSAPEKSSNFVSGIFVAPELSSNATLEEWSDALVAMKAIGVHTVIIQFSLQTDSLYGNQAYFDFWQPDTVYDAWQYPERRKQIFRILQAAQDNNIKVYLGLQLAEREWFALHMFQDDAWLNHQYLLSADLADALWNEFAAGYGDIIAGWYLPFEFESVSAYHDYFAKITELYYGHLTAYLKNNYGGLPIMISPLMYAYDDKDKWQENLVTVLSGSQIDIIAPQDGIGFGTQTHATVGDWYRITRLAVEAVNGAYGKNISLWGNCENYMRQRDYNDKLESIKPLDIGKFINSLETVAPYVEDFITFSIHRWDACMQNNKNLGINKSYYEAYKTYYQTGLKPLSKAAGQYVIIESKGELTFNQYANAGLTDGFALYPDNWNEYKGIRLQNAKTFTMEIRFDDPVSISSITSHYYKDASAGINLPQSVNYEYLVRAAPNTSIFKYYIFAFEKRSGFGPQITSAANRNAAVMADGIRITVQPTGEWTFIDEIWVK
jgi:hypothetical protein